MRRGSSSGLLTVLGWLRVGPDMASKPAWATAGLAATDSGAPEEGAGSGVCTTMDDSSAAHPEGEILVSLSYINTVCSLPGIVCRAKSLTVMKSEWGHTGSSAISANSRAGDIKQCGVSQISRLTKLISHYPVAPAASRTDEQQYTVWENSQRRRRSGTGGSGWRRPAARWRPAISLEQRIGLVDGALRPAAHALHEALVLVLDLLHLPPAQPALRASKCIPSRYR